MGRVLGRLEALDRELQSRAAHPIMGTASLHASIIDGGREWSSYPDRSMLRMERRTIASESAAVAADEIERILEHLRQADLDFKASGKLVFARPRTQTPDGHPLVATLDECIVANGYADGGSWNEFLDGRGDPG